MVDFTVRRALETRETISATDRITLQSVATASYKLSLIGVKPYDERNSFENTEFIVGDVSLGHGALALGRLESFLKAVPRYSQIHLQYPSADIYMGAFGEPNSPFNSEPMRSQLNRICVDRNLEVHYPLAPSGTRESQ